MKKTLEQNYISVVLVISDEKGNFTERIEKIRNIKETSRNTTTSVVLYKNG